MSMDVGGAKGGIKADINVTPLVDVMLVLLIIMMLIAPMLQQGVQLRLPVAGNTKDKPSTQEGTDIAIAANKDVYLNARLVPRGELVSRLTEHLEGKTERTVFIKADTEVEYGAVMNVMDELRQAGIEDVALITDPKKGAEQAAGGR